MVKILFVLLILHGNINGQSTVPVTVDFFGDTISSSYNAGPGLSITLPIKDEAIESFYLKADRRNFSSLINALLQYKNEHRLDDWLYYQLIRATAEKISPKAENYERYTLYKWFFLLKSGYASTLNINEKKLLLYVQSDELVYNIPYHTIQGKQYVCLNYHDYLNIDFYKEAFTRMSIDLPPNSKSFSYKISSLPDFKKEQLEEKELQFDYYQTAYHFKLKLNKDIKKIFANYPVVDYANYFNIPLSRSTYTSIIPAMQKYLKGKSQKDGIDYLMRFTRNTLSFKGDTKVFGSEKRFTPEQTLLHEFSDCEDRAALFFYLVKELYNLPMIVLSYPEHITVAVGLDSPAGTPIIFNGQPYYVCEPTPQKKDLKIGQIAPFLKNQPHEIVYAYDPLNKQK